MSYFPFKYPFYGAEICKSMHLPIVQFSWHGLGSSGYTKEEVSQLELGYSNIGLSTFVYG